MNIPIILAKVRDGTVLSSAELKEFAQGLASGEVSDSQAGAFAMAVCVNGLTENERFGGETGNGVRHKLRKV